MSEMLSTDKSGHEHQDPTWVRCIDLLSMLSATLGGIVALCLMLNVVLDVASRYLFDTHMPGTLDLTQYAWMPALISLGLGYALLRGEHIRVSLLTISAGFRAQRIVEIGAMVVTFFSVTLLLWYSIDRAMESTRSGEHAVVTAWLDIWPVRWMVVFGFGVLLLQVVAELWRSIKATSDMPIEADAQASLADVSALQSDASARSDDGSQKRR